MPTRSRTVGLTEALIRAFVDNCRSGISARFLTAALLLVVSGGVAVVPGPASAAAPAADDEAATAVFTSGRVPRLHIQLSTAAADSLRGDPRAWVECTLAEDGGGSHERVAIRIKGSAGSGRGLDDRPALTVNMDRHVRGRRFHGLDKFHLNNAVQDDSLLRELLGSEIFRAAGIPAPRVTHARLRIDDHDLGLYVLKESYDEDFLRRSFPRADGNLYDGGAGQEIDEGLERDEGKNGEAGADLARIAAACRIVDDTARWRTLDRCVARDAFLDFAALEAMTGHWDGYCNARNNYRVYLDPAVGDRARFLPHGMDQIFTDSHAGIIEPPNGIVAAAILENPEWRRRYRERTRKLLPLFSAHDRLLPIAATTVERLRPLVAEAGGEPLERFDAAVGQLREILEQREASLREQAAAADPLVWPARLQWVVRELNAADEAAGDVEIPNSQADVFLRQNIPWFECPDAELEREYYRRWWTLRRHVRHTDEGPILSGLPADFGDAFADARWLRDLRLTRLAEMPRSAEPESGRTCDRVITEFAGLRLHPDNTVEVDPAPPTGWPWFAIDRITYQGRRLAIIWDETGERYGRGRGMRVFVDDAEVAHRDTLGRIVTRLP